MFPRSHRTLDGSVLVMCDTGGPGLTLVLVSDTYMLTRVNRSNWRPDIWIQAKHSRGVVLTTIWITYLAFLRQHQTSAPITLCLEIQESSAEDCILYPKSNRRVNLANLTIIIQPTSRPGLVSVSAELILPRPLLRAVTIMFMG